MHKGIELIVKFLKNSYMYEEKGHRLFSYFLMESMLKGRTSIKDIYSDVYIQVKDKSYEASRAYYSKK